MARRRVLDVLGVVVIPFVLDGCGEGPTPTPAPPSPSPEDSTTTPAPAPTYNLPDLQVLHCAADLSSSAAAQDYFPTTQGYFVTNVEGDQPATWEAETTVCWDADGIHVVTNNTDYNIFQKCTECPCQIWRQGDVAELFLAPVSNASMAPSWYYELDVGAVTSSFWGGIIHNSLGNDTLYSSSLECSVEAPDDSFASCVLNCTGDPLPEVAVEQGDGWWSRTMTIPWTMFDEQFTPAGHASDPGSPWPLWRGNFYRYSYPKEFDNGTYSQEYYSHELSGWSPTHNPSFHVPAAFGYLHFSPLPTTISM